MASLPDWIQVSQIDPLSGLLLGRTGLHQNEYIAHQRQDNPDKTGSCPLIALEQGRQRQCHNGEKNGGIGCSLRFDAPQQGKVGSKTDHRSDNCQVEQ